MPGRSRPRPDIEWPDTLGFASAFGPVDGEAKFHVDNGSLVAVPAVFNARPWTGATGNNLASSIDVNAPAPTPQLVASVLEAPSCNIASRGMPLNSMPSPTVADVSASGRVASSFAPFRQVRQAIPLPFPTMHVTTGYQVPQNLYLPSIGSANTPPRTLNGSVCNNTNDGAWLAQQTPPHHVTTRSPLAANASTGDSAGGPTGLHDHHQSNSAPYFPQGDPPHLGAPPLPMPDDGARLAPPASPNLTTPQQASFDIGYGQRSKEIPSWNLQHIMNVSDPYDYVYEARPSPPAYNLAAAQQVTSFPPTPEASATTPTPTLTGHKRPSGVSSVTLPVPEGRHGQSTDTIAPNAEPRHNLKESVDPVARNHAGNIDEERRSHLFEASRLGFDCGPLDVSSNDLSVGCSRKAATAVPGRGSFPMVSNGVDVAKGRHGTLFRFACSTCRTNKRKNKQSDLVAFALTYEYTYEGFRVWHCQPVHNHALKEIEASVQVTQAGRDDFLDREVWLGNLLSLAGQTADDIRHVFMVLASQESRPAPSYSYKDVYNRFVRASTELELDIRGLVELLLTRRDTKGLEFEIDTEYGLGKVKRVFIVVNRAHHVWGTYRKSFVMDLPVVLDATFGTNTYGLKLTTFVTVDADGKTVILAVCLHREESLDDMLWAMRCFHKFFKKKPSSIWTDSAIGLIQAVAKMCEPGGPWEGSNHCLCIFHVFKNLYEHLHCLYAKKPDAWNACTNLFWKLAKVPDLELFEEDNSLTLTMLREHIVEHGRGETKKKALEWFDTTLCARAAYWMARDTWMSLSLGVHSTQRTEQTGGALKRIVRANSTITKLLKGVDSYDFDRELRTAVQREQLIVKQSVVKHRNPLLDKVKANISPYAFELLEGQFAAVTNYTSWPVPDWSMHSDIVQGDPPGTNYYVAPLPSVEATVCTPCNPSIHPPGHISHTEWPRDNGVGDYTRWHWTSRMNCSCLYKDSTGVPCRHVLHIILTHGFNAQISSILELFAVRWLVVPTRVYAEGGIPPDQQPMHSGNVTADYEGLVSIMSLAQMDFVNFDASTFSSITSSLRSSDMSSMYGSYVVLKQGGKKTTKWHIGKVNPPEDSKRFSCNLYYEYTDGMTQDVNLKPELMKMGMQKEEICCAWTWFPLQPRPLGVDVQDVDVAHSLTGPDKRQQKGRPQTNRFRPTHGPTS